GGAEKQGQEAAENAREGEIGGSAIFASSALMRSRRDRKNGSFPISKPPALSPGSAASDASSSASLAACSSWIVRPSALPAVCSSAGTSDAFRLSRVIRAAVHVA